MLSICRRNILRAGGESDAFSGRQGSRAGTPGDNKCSALLKLLTGAYVASGAKQRKASQSLTPGSH